MKDAETEKIEEKRGEMEEPEDGWPEIVVKDEDIRVPSELLNEVLRVKLGENDCRNRGYILDSFPRLYKGAQRAFLMKPPKKEGEEDDDEEEDDDDDPKPPEADGSPGSSFLTFGGGDGSSSFSVPSFFSFSPLPFPATVQSCESLALK